MLPRLLLSLFLIVGILQVGCNQSPQATETDGFVADDLSKLESAYRVFLDEHGTPPESAEDLDLPAELSLISPRDGKPFKIYWGTDINKANPDRTVQTLLAHEVDGDGETRMVITNFGVMTMNENDFSQAVKGNTSSDSNDSNSSTSTE